MADSAAAASAPAAEQPPADEAAPAAAPAKGKQKPKKEKKKKEKKSKGGAAAGPKFAVLEPAPAYLAERLAYFDELYALQQAELEKRETKPIKITLPDGKVIEGESWRTTPYNIAEGISSGLANTVVVAVVNGVKWDLDRPFEEDATVELLKFDTEKGTHTFRHSSAHILGLAMERLYGGSLCAGPPVQQGFYYDMHMDGMADGKTVSDADLPVIETVAKQLIKQKAPFQRLVATKEQLLKLFAYNKLKQRIITEKIPEATATVYKCGDLIDLCTGPHVRHTGKVKEMTIFKASSSYYEGDAELESLQRVYGISFPDKKQLKAWKLMMEEAKKRDHRKIGVQQELFFFDELSPGSCFFLPRGAYIYNQLIDYMRSEYKKRGFSEVITPNIFNSKLWETSGHWQHYQDDMFSFETEGETWALKPMNCPSHCVMFRHRTRSYKELPLRLADFGVLHRNEDSGALSGLTRVRRFQQDDAHIFVMPSQIETEMAACLDFLMCVYEQFGFTFELNLSTRPKKYLGDIAVWDRAEESLKNSLNKFQADTGHSWQLNPEDGAFYGPKIDITIKDALGRPFQCATIQLDFQLPLRFELEYVPAERNADGSPSRPVIIHRAILGSVERFIAILTENFAGKWPFWLCPRQAVVIPVVPAYNDYAEEVAAMFKHAGFMVDADVDDGCTLNKKVRNAQTQNYTFCFVVGETEQEARTVAIRGADGKSQGVRTLDEVKAHFSMLMHAKPKTPHFPAGEGSDAAALAPAAKAKAEKKPAAPAEPAPEPAAAAPAKVEPIPFELNDAYKTFDDDASFGKPAPVLDSLKYVKGEPVVLGGGKITVVLFFAKFAKGDYTTVQGVSELAGLFPQVQFLGISCDPAEDDAKSFLKKIGTSMPEIYIDNLQVPYPLAWDDRKVVKCKFMQLAGLASLGASATFVVDGAGTVVWREQFGQGYFPPKKGQLCEQVRRLVAGEPLLKTNGATPVVEEEEDEEMEMDGADDYDDDLGF